MTARRAALRRLLEDWEAGIATIVFESEIAEASELVLAGIVKSTGVRTMRLTDAGLALARRDEGGAG